MAYLKQMFDEREIAHLSEDGQYLCANEGVLQYKKDLQEAAHITHYQMMKLARDENITTEIIGNICKALNCTPDEIMEFYDA